MAKPYAARQATARIMTSQLDSLGGILGMFLKVTRDYTLAEGKSTQAAIAAAADVSQTMISNLETCKKIPGAKTLPQIVDAYGFEKAEGELVLAFLSLLRDNGSTIASLDKIRG